MLFGVPDVVVATNLSGFRPALSRPPGLLARKNRIPDEIHNLNPQVNAVGEVCIYLELLLAQQPRSRTNARTFGNNCTVSFFAQCPFDSVPVRAIERVEKDNSLPPFPLVVLRQVRADLVCAPWWWEKTACDFQGIQ